MQARYYDPVIGRFYSNDPAGTMEHLSGGNIHGFGRYAYANNNPYKYVDPDGKTGIPINLGTNKNNSSGTQKARQIQKKVQQKSVSSLNLSSEQLKLISDTANATAVMSPVGKTVAGLTALLAETKDILDNSESKGQDLTAKALGEAAGEVAGKKIEKVLKATGAENLVKETVQEALKQEVSGTVEKAITK